MLAFRKIQPASGAALADIDMPAVGPDQAVVRVMAAGICGSDLHAYDYSPGYEFMAAHMPVTLGHEFSGVVERVGADVTDPAVGDRVTCWPTITCGRCAGCTSGHPARCEDRRIVGLHRDGAFAQFATVPAHTLRRLPEGLALDRAALTEPLSVAVNAVNLAQVEHGDRVVVLGPGPIGMAIAWIAAHRGAQVLLVGKGDAARLATARQMGIAHTADLDDAPLAQAVQATFGDRIDRVIEATGITASVEQGLEILRPAGILVAAGIHARPCTIDLTRLVREKKQIRGAHDTDPAAFSEAMTLLATHGDILDRLITHRLPLTRADEAMALARSGTAMKVLLTPTPEVLP